MKNSLNSAISVKVGCGLLVGILTRGQVYGCACGCTVFDVGTSSMFPSGQGGMVFMQYAYQDQNRNWSGTSEAPANNNDDKDIETHFATLGLQYMFNWNWGIQAELPYDSRYFKARDEAGNIVSRNWSQLGDIRIQGIYTGFSPDLSAGVTFGVKLPTGSFSYDSDVVDRDTQIGTGSTDILLGGFYRNNLGQTGHWDWFAQLQLDVPTLIQAGYRPGVELDAAAGPYYRGLQFGRVRVSPLAQVIFSERTSDSGAAADPDNTGYQRILLSPGLECRLNRIAIYADAELPVYQHFTGNQLAAPVMLKAILSYMF